MRAATGNHLRCQIVFGVAPKDRFVVSASIVGADDRHNPRLGVYEERNHSTTTVVCDAQAR